MTWRDRFRPIIAGVLASNPNADEKALRQALREAWPRREPRGSWPYRIWLDEIRRQLDQRRGLHVIDTRPRRKVRTMTAEQARQWIEERQMKLFGETE